MIRRVLFFIQKTKSFTYDQQLRKQIQIFRLILARVLGGQSYAFYQVVERLSDTQQIVRIDATSKVWRTLTGHNRSGELLQFFDQL